MNAQAEAPKRPATPWIIALTVTLATFMEVLDTSIANVALPHIAGRHPGEVSRPLAAPLVLLLKNVDRGKAASVAVH